MSSSPFHEEQILLTCKYCGINEEETTTLTKCPMCYAIFCTDCGYNFGGRPFCSKVCAEYFYFADGEDG